MSLGVFACGLAAQQAAPSLRVERELVLRGGPCHALAWSADGTRVVSAGRCGDVVLLDVETGAVVHESVTPGDVAGAVSFAPDGSRHVVAAAELRLCDAADGRVLATRDVAGNWAHAWNRDGSRLAVAASNERVVLLRGDDLTEVGALAVPDGDAHCHSLAWSPDDRRIAVGKVSGVTVVLDVDRGDEVERIAHDSAVQQLAWLDDGRLLRLAWQGVLHGRRTESTRLGDYAWNLSADRAGQLAVVWDGRTVRGFVRDANEPFVVDGDGGACAVHADGERWVRAFGGGLEFFRGAERQRRVPLPLRATPEQAAFAGNGKHVALRDHQGRIAVFAVADGARVDVPAAVTGMPVRYDGGAELALWQPPAEGGAETDARFVLWSIDALLAGGSEPVRSQSLPGSPTTGSVPEFSRDGRFATVRGITRDLLRPEAEPWGYDAPLPTHAVPSSDGSCVVTYTVQWLLSGMQPRCELARFDRDGTTVAGPEVLESGLAVRWSPNGARIGFLTTTGLRLLDPKALQQTEHLHGEWQSFEWLDGEHFVAVSAVGVSEQEEKQLTLHRLGEAGSLASLAIPDYGTLLCVDPAGERAVVSQRDRALLVRIELGTR